MMSIVNSVGSQGEGVHGKCKYKLRNCIMFYKELQNDAQNEGEREQGEIL